MADKPVGRPMKFPYTTAAQIAQFPFKFHFQNQAYWKFYVISLVVCLPVFYKLKKLTNSPGNVAKWEEARKKEAAEHH